MHMKLEGLSMSYEVLEEARQREPPAAKPEGWKTLARVEREHILRTVEVCGGNLTMVAEVLEISRSTIHRKIREYKKADEAAARS